jgi:ABC-2 type transport system permease protein
MRWLRLVLVGGLMSYRALFDWLSPWILVPSFLVTPLAQILLFAYIGRSAGVGSDAFFLVGNAVQCCAIPCLFGMTNTIVGERLTHTLGLLFTSPAPRLALVLGRSLPVLLNAFAVSLVSLMLGGATLGVQFGPPTLAAISLGMLASAWSCVGLGLVVAACGLRLRDNAVITNIAFGMLLIFTGAAVPRDALAGWMNHIGNWLPLTHGIEATRTLASGAGFVGVVRPLGTELLIGTCYGVAGLLLLRLLEVRSRRVASLELA